jgi:acyl-CoA synthetase (AMP-forming)/AMP-acid ligase II
VNLERYLSPYSPPSTNIADCLEYWTEQLPSAQGFCFTDGDADSDVADVTLTYAQLDRRARAIAARLTELKMRGERVLLLFPPGLDFVVGFFGCMYEGAVAVPA